MEDKSKTFTWEWEDGETGLIRTIKIPMPNLDRDYGPSESREIVSVPNLGPPVSRDFRFLS